MLSPRTYHSIVRFKSTSPYIDDYIWINHWTKTGTLNFTTSSRFDNLKYESRVCLRYDMSKTGYISLAGSDYDTEEITISFWFKVDKEFLRYREDYNAKIPIIFWQDCAIYVYDSTGSNIYNSKFAISIESPLMTNIIQIPYPLEDYVDKWSHFMFSVDINKIGRVYINGMKFYEGYVNDFLPDNQRLMKNIMIGNPPVYHGGVIINYPRKVYVYIDEIALCRTCITEDQFYPYPKYLHGFYPSADVVDTTKYIRSAGRTKYDNVNDAIPITRPVYYRPPFGWEYDNVTKFRFDREEPFASSHFDRWMKHRTDYFGDYYRNLGPDDAIPPK